MYLCGFFLLILLCKIVVVFVIEVYGLVDWVLIKVYGVLYFFFGDLDKGFRSFLNFLYME